MLSDTATASNETGILQTDRIVRHLVEKLSDILAKSSTTTDTATASTLLPTLISGDIQQQQELLSHLLSDYLPSNTHVDVATQVTNRTISAILFYFLFFRLHHLRAPNRKTYNWVVISYLFIGIWQINNSCDNKTRTDYLEFSLRFFETCYTRLFSNMLNLSRWMKISLFRQASEFYYK